MKTLPLIAGAGYDENGKTFAGMGVDAADYDNDGLPDVVITTLSYQTYPLFHNNGDLSFNYSDEAVGRGSDHSCLIPAGALTLLTLTTMACETSSSPRVTCSTRSKSRPAI